MFKTILLSILLLSCSTHADKSNPEVEKSITGLVISVKDGDTIEILYNDEPLTIRLADIDCPEKKQPFGTAAKKFTSEKCFNRTVVIENNGKYDRYGRLIGTVINDLGENVNKELVMAGLAWHFKKYSTDSVFAQLEIEARENKIGLWSEPGPIPPWEWRK